GLLACLVEFFLGHIQLVRHDLQVALELLILVVGPAKALKQSIVLLLQRGLEILLCRLVLAHRAPAEPDPHQRSHSQSRNGQAYPPGCACLGIGILKLAHVRRLLFRRSRRVTWKWALSEPK